MSAGCLTDDLKRSVNKQDWTYSKTMPDWPHEYLVRDRVDEELFKQLVTFISKHGHEGRFYSNKYIYYEEDGMLF